MVETVSAPETADGVLAGERVLLERAQAGDRAALRDLLDWHAGALYGQVILPRAGDATVAEDILRATMVTAIEKLPTLKWQGRSIYHWLRRVAVNKVIDHHRRGQRARRLADALAAEPTPSVLPSAQPGAEEALIAAQERHINLERVGAALERLNPRYQRAIRLRLLDELPREDCARELDVSVGTFDVVLFRALKALRKAFEREEI